jgi:hypothetical protein
MMYGSKETKCLGQKLLTYGVKSFGAPYVVRNAGALALMQFVDVRFLVS